MAFKMWHKTYNETKEFKAGDNLSKRNTLLHRDIDLEARRSDLEEHVVQLDKKGIPKWRVVGWLANKM